MTITGNNGCGVTHKFEVTDKIPNGYRIWNVGPDYLPGYLPLCAPGPRDFEWQETVDINTLKAIPCDPKAAAILHRVSMHYGVGNKAEAKRFLSRAKNEYRRTLVSKALDIFETISERGNG